jgi:small conductance mechanosensitive channel
MPTQSSLDQIRTTVIDLALRFGPKLLVALLILVIGLFASRWASRWFVRAIRRVELEPPVRALLARLVWVVTFALFVILALQNLGVQLLPLIAGLGVAGAGIALATQGVLSNVVAGLSIIFVKPFRVGEYIAVAGVEGEVSSISLFSTVLLHVDRSRVVIPNRKIVGEILHNYGRIRQLDLTVCVGYDVGLDVALGLIRGVLQANARVLADPAAVVQATNLGDSVITVAVRPWVGVPDVVAANGEINDAILAAFRGAGFSLPPPQREIRLLSAAGRGAHPG